MTKFRLFASRLAQAKNSFGSGVTRRHSIRSIPLQSETQFFQAPLAEKLRIRVRCFSSTDLPPHIIVGMPALSPTMNHGNIAKWKKKEGDKINSGDVLCEIETDKATLEFESVEEGFLAKILTPEGSKDVPVGQPIAITVEDLEDIKNIPAAISSAPEKRDVKQTHEDMDQNGLRPNLSNASDLPPHIILEMPALSPTMNKGNILKWMKKEGDKINPGDVLCEIETDKATLEFESTEEGFLAKVLIPEGSKDVPVGQPIAITVENPEDVKNIPFTISAGLEKTDEKPIHKDRGQKEVSEKTSFSRISPSAKLLIREFGLDASTLKASGPRNTLLKGDILAAIKSGISSRTHGSPQEKISTSIHQPQSIAYSPPESKIPALLTDRHEDIPNSQIRKVIAKRLIESKQNVPHLYLASDVVLDSLLAFRNVLKEQHNVKVSINDIIIKAVAVALREVPEANAFWNAEREEVSLCPTVDISIAVASDKGLITPIVRNADQKTLSAISLEVKGLAEKARSGKLAPNEYQGGTFSISNLGMFPVDNFCAIINPPQACILAVGRANKIVTPMLGSDGIEVPAVVTKMNLNLSADHRVFDGEIGGKFLSALSANLSDVRRLML